MRRSRPRRLLPFRLAAAAVLAVSAVGCAEDVELAPPAAPSEAKPGGRLVVGISEPTSIEPSNAADAAGALIVRTMCDPLIQLDPLTGALVPAIAESWQLTDAGRRFTIKLREGVLFHDGRELTAEDVVFSLSRTADDETASPLAGLLQPILGYEQVHGDEEATDERLRTMLQGLRVIENYSFEITLKEPRAEFIRMLAHPLSSPISKEAAEADPVAFARLPVCAGPYRLSEPWSAGQDSTVRLTRFDDYKPVNEGYTAAGRGYADEIEFRMFADRQVEYDEFLTGGLDAAHVPRAQIADPERTTGVLVQSPSPTLEYIGLPTAVAPFDDVNVRRALSQAIDRQVIVAAAYTGAAVPARGILPPTLGDTYRESACGGLVPVTADVDAARATLSASGVDLNGRRIALTFNDEFGHRALVEAVAQQWKAAFAVEVELVPLAWESYIALGEGVAGFDTPFRLSWVAEYPSADAYLAPLFSSTNIGRTNLTRFDDPEFDRILDRVARRAVDPGDRRLDYQRLEDLACDQMPLIPVVFPTTNHLVSEDLASARGGFADSITADLLLRELYRR